MSAAPQDRRRRSQEGRGRLPVLILALLGLLPIACQTQGPMRLNSGVAAETAVPPAATTAQTFVRGGKLPRRIAVPPPRAADDKSLDPPIARLIRDVLRNYLAGKGFALADSRATEDCAAAREPTAAVSDVRGLLDCLDKASIVADGIAWIDVKQFSAINVGFVERYVLEASVTLVDAAGAVVGTWQDQASRRKVSVALDPLGAVLTLATSAITAAGDVHRRDVVYDWAYNITALMPSLPRSSRLPQISRVVTNIGQHTFKQGDQIAVGFEGDRNLQAHFDLGDFRQKLPMTEKESGVYIGTYVVRDRDQTKSQPLILRVEATDGSRRDWPEPAYLASVDGKPPAMPQLLQAARQGNQVELSWQSEDPEITGFQIQRSTNPLAGYEDLADARTFQWRDEAVQEGATYYYRVRAKDHAGNLSAPVMSQPVTIPLSGETRLSGALTGQLVAGHYRIDADVEVPSGHSLELTSGVTLAFAPETGLRVKGSLKGKRVTFQLQQPEEIKTAASPRWRGITVAAGGTLELQASDLTQCQACLTLDGGQGRLTDCRLQDGGSGVLLLNNALMSIQQGRLQNLATGLTLTSGKLQLEGSSISDNVTGILVEGGVLNMQHANLQQNTRNLVTSVPLTLQGNYLGGLKPNRLGLQGPVTLRSLLDAPWPGGREQTVDAEANAAQALALREQGTAAFEARNYGQAYEDLQASLDWQEDRTTRLYLAYVLNSLGENAELEQLLRLAVELYPYEIRFYNLAIRNLLATDRKREARQMLDTALRLNPGNPTLEGLKTLAGS